MKGWLVIAGCILGIVAFIGFLWLIGSPEQAVEVVEHH
jgi:hypothetical protein